MDGYSFTDIFETKGIEYLIIIAFLIILIPFWIIINKQLPVAKKIHKMMGVITARILRLPQGLFYSKNHTWAFMEKSGNAKVGFDDFLLQVVGDVNVKQLKSPGEKLRKGEVFAEIDQRGKKLRILSPISGEIVATNLTLSESPGLMQEDPYGEGWIYAIKPTHWLAETNKYYLAEEATFWLTKEIDRLKDFLAMALGKYSSEPSMITYQEGGELRKNILSDLDDKIWAEFQDTFLS
jgi:glycine cleavage system H protein